MLEWIFPKEIQQKLAYSTLIYFIFKMKKEFLLYCLFVLSFLIIFFYTIYAKIFEYLLDSTFSILIISFLLLFYKQLNLNRISFSLIFVALIFHDLGIFGFYNQSPFIFPYDNLTHFLGGFSLTILFLNYFSKFSNKNFNKYFLFLASFLCALGVGAVIDLVDYFGFLFLGEGQGVFYFGGTGDLINNNLGSAWINSSIDNLFNLIGALIGIMFYFIFKKVNKL